MSLLSGIFLYRNLHSISTGTRTATAANGLSSMAICHASIFSP